MFAKLNTFLRSAAMVLTLALAAQGSAQAGLVTGNWDPAFGAFLPGLSWQARAEFNVPDACSTQTDGIYSTSSGLCQIVGNPFVNVWLRLFDTGFADPNDFFTVVGGPPVRSTYWTLTGGFSSISNVRIVAGQVVGFDAPTTTSAQTVVCTDPPGCANLVSYPSSAGGNLFQLTFDTSGPNLACLNCRQSINDPLGTSTVNASRAGLTQFLVTYTDSGPAKFNDANGNPLGAVLDSEGGYLRQSTSPQSGSRQPNPAPEPGSLLLVLAALGAAGVARRRA